MREKTSIKQLDNCREALRARELRPHSTTLFTHTALQKSRDVSTRQELLTSL